MEKADELQKQRELEEARRKEAAPASPLKTGRAKLTAAKEVFSLAKYVNFSTDWMYFIVVGIAVLKDILDFPGIGSLLVIGTAITICVSVLIGFISFLIGVQNEGNTIRGTFKKLLILFGGTGIEAFLFGVNFIPVETAAALGIYVIMLMERREAAEGQKRLDQEAEEMSTSQSAQNQINPDLERLAASRAADNYPQEEPLKKAA